MTSEQVGIQVNYFLLYVWKHTLIVFIFFKHSKWWLIYLAAVLNDGVFPN